MFIANMQDIMDITCISLYMLVYYNVYFQSFGTKHAIYSWNKANLRDLIAATGLAILLKLDSYRQIFSPCDLEIWWMTLKNNRASLLYYAKLCTSFQTHRWIQTGVTIRKRTIWVKLVTFCPVTFKFDGRHWKSIGQLLYTTLSFAYHFKATGEFKLELQPGNAQFGSKSAIFFLSRVTLKFDGWHWKTIGRLF